MNRFEVIGIANQVYGSDTKWNGIQLQRLLRLAELFRAAEREQCVFVCEQVAAAARADWDKRQDEVVMGRAMAADDCAARIKAREADAKAQ